MRRKTKMPFSFIKIIVYWHVWYLYLFHWQPHQPKVHLLAAFSIHSCVIRTKEAAISFRFFFSVLIDFKCSRIPRLQWTGKFNARSLIYHVESDCGRSYVSKNSPISRDGAFCPFATIQSRKLNKNLIFAKRTTSFGVCSSCVLLYARQLFVIIFSYNVSDVASFLFPFAHWVCTSAIIHSHRRLSAAPIRTQWKFFVD